MTRTLKAIVIRQDHGETNEELFAKYRQEAIDAMSKVAVVDQAKVELDEVSRDASVNLGTPEEPYLLSLWQHNLVATLFTTEADPSKYFSVNHIDRKYETSWVDER